MDIPTDQGRECNVSSFGASGAIHVPQKLIHPFGAFGIQQGVKPYTKGEMHSKPRDLVEITLSEIHEKTFVNRIQVLG
jgi:hypothetical protein